MSTRGFYDGVALIRVADHLVYDYGADVPDSEVTLWSERTGHSAAAIREAVASMVGRSGVTRTTLDTTGLRVRDLTALEAGRLTIAGVEHCLMRAEILRFGARRYLLVPEPDNPVDPHAVAVYSGQRHVGYLPASRAVGIAPLLRQLDADAVEVTGTTDYQVDVPRVPALRAVVKDGRAARG
ncbi:hypothetical protein Xcel_2141 [Xylanimonas cellulosilytica DSM 15894]|uniref:HIRAN domain-containing protein n=1 Tax=Xylanimonas cellulosilytica (strain DSM 15894 / JCM 12276 / CECT 5975 / KCTC 9989 / LMG 20990 / NBRC 107835 / XIL07) TaxID=446471 RepID=D1BUE6_XYLCX|nr:HIRAN domain-containing protein [Xylanimonas cellulosilytica]ACZ31159.1 hypothetical protein Xcel_2141 [Xylanimonas cellulosilytica DSM 15894]